MGNIVGILVSRSCLHWIQLQSCISKAQKEAVLDHTHTIRTRLFKYLKGRIMHTYCSNALSAFSPLLCPLCVYFILPPPHLFLLLISSIIFNLSCPSI